MIKTVIFDVDGIVIKREMYFSQRFSEEFNVSIKKLLPFFENDFSDCLIGKADLKEELKKYLNQWGWKKSIDELLVYWFTNEGKLDYKIIENIKDLRRRGVKCYLDTNNEKYRVRYLIEDLGLNNLSDGVFSSCQLGFKKPQTEFWSALYEQLGKPDKNEVLVWDDDQENVVSAKNFGFQSELYTTFEDYQNKMNLLIMNTLK